MCAIRSVSSEGHGRTTLEPLREFSVLFLTPELYQFMQQPAVPDEIKQDRWGAAAQARLAHHEAIKPRLPECMRHFCDITLHDGVIGAVRRPAPGEILLEIDGRSCPWGPRGR
jgi:hypothetical protein